MKKSVISAAIMLLPVALMAQSSIDVYNLNPYQLRGTSRFISMGGAFTALGGDLSTLKQNPAGIGIYRSSEIGLTLDIDAQSSETNSNGFRQSSDQTKFSCDNFGYVGAVNLGNDVMPYFSWGASYDRVASFDRMVRGGGMLGGSLSNYIADFTGGTNPAQMEGDLAYDSSADWLSTLAYNAYMINPFVDEHGNYYYKGLWNNNSTGDATFRLREKGYIDEYNIDFGGNLMNTVYWGIGFGLTDLSYTSQAYYDEIIDNAMVLTADNQSLTPGYAQYAMDNWTQVTGNGFNFKAGLIFKPINELRLGIAVHTPTYYNLTTSFRGLTNYEYAQYINNSSELTHSSYAGGNDYPSETPIATYDWKMHSPWKLMIGAAAVIGKEGILSLDYERQAYGNMSAQDYYGDDLDDVNDDINNTFKATNIIRLGAEYRLTPNFSIRGGFNYATSNVQEDAEDSRIPIYTAGTNSSYILNQDTYYLTCGLGYRYKGFYIDLAYAYRNAQSTWHGFTSCAYDTYAQAYYKTGAPTAKITEENSHFTMSIGMKF